ncbi:MAG: glycosyltransferase [bacterium JZ-2024 1]
MKPILLLCTEPITEHIGGLAIRYFRLASLLQPHFPLSFWAPAWKKKPDEGLPLWDGKNISHYGAIIAPPNAWLYFPHLETYNVPLVWDLMHPLPVENLFLFPEEEVQWNYSSLLMTLCLLTGSVFLIATPKQREWYALHYTALGRKSEKDPWILFPPSPPPEPFPQVPDEGQKFLLWLGGLWDWLDPLTALKGFLLVADQVPFDLLFLGATHLPGYLTRTRWLEILLRHSPPSLLREGRIQFHDWVPYSERVNFLAKSVAGISLHPRSMESAYAFRGRILDYLWAGLPVLATEGEFLGELCARHGSAILIPPSDPDAFSRAILSLLSPQTWNTLSHHSLSLLKKWNDLFPPEPLIQALPHLSPPHLSPLVSRTKNKLFFLRRKISSPLYHLFHTLKKRSIQKKRVQTI